MKFRTVSGSLYELDVEGNRIRRVSGSHPVIGDGEWRSYQSISPIEVGKCAVIAWSVDAPLLSPCTLTTRVTSTEQ